MAVSIVTMIGGGTLVSMATTSSGGWGSIFISQSEYLKCLYLPTNQP